MPATRKTSVQIYTPDYWEEACKHLAKKDRVMKRLIPKFGEAFSHRLCQLWQFSGAEENERDDEDEEQLSATEAIENECEEHGYLPSCKMRTL